MFDNLTASPPLPSIGQQQTDIYAILSSDDPSVHVDDENIDTDALVMNMFDPPPNSNFNQQDFFNLDSARSQPSQYTPSSDVSIDSIFSLNYPPEEDPDFSRRHSVAVSGGITDLNRRNLSQNMEHYQQQQQQPCFALPQNQVNKQLARKSHQQLATVIEGEAPTDASQPNILHRASMPDIFLSEESQRKVTASIQQRAEPPSARTTPSNTPPAASISFNQMPWSTSNNTNDTAESRSNKNPSSQQHPEYSKNLGVSHSFLPAPTTTASAKDCHFVGRKRFYSQQFDSFPTNAAAMPHLFSATPAFHQPIQPQPQPQQQSSNICPLPMSGVKSRRASVATSNDISTWNRMVNNNDRITLDRQQEKRKRQKQAQMANNNDPFLYREMPQQIALKQEDPTNNAENTSLTDNVTTADDSTTPNNEQEDYPVITEADLEAAKKNPNAIPRRQKLRYEGDEYTPKWVRYTGQLKEGYCDTCKPGKWLQLKNSAFWYHKQFFHGISSVSGKPFQRPLEQRAGQHDVIEGFCHQCKLFVPICNSKRKNSVLWYRHAHKCHIYDKPKPKGGKRASMSGSSCNYSNNNKRK